MNNIKKLYSVVVPMYNEELVIMETYKRISEVMMKVDGDYEIILVNDGSQDSTEKIAKEICLLDPKVKFLNFSRNFGHQLAVTAGMDYSKGDGVILIDADLQDPPELMLDMIDKYNEGYDIVYAIRKKRKGETFLKKATAKLFYKFLRKMTEVEIPADVGDFRLISRPVCDSLLQIRERNRFIRGLVSWTGYKSIGIEYVRESRFAGESKYPLRKMIQFSKDGITSFSAKPLRLSSFAGFILAMLGFLYAIYVIIGKFLYNNSIEGWTTLIVLLMIISGFNLISIGILGEYIARIYDEAKARPLYIIKEFINIEEVEKK